LRKKIGVLGWLAIGPAGPLNVVVPLASAQAAASASNQSRDWNRLGLTRLTLQLNSATRKCDRRSSPRFGEGSPAPRVTARPLPSAATGPVRACRHRPTVTPARTAHQPHGWHRTAIDGRRAGPFRFRKARAAPQCAFAAAARAISGAKSLPMMARHGGGLCDAWGGKGEVGQRGGKGVGGILPTCGGSGRERFFVVDCMGANGRLIGRLEGCAGRDEARPRPPGRGSAGVCVRTLWRAWAMRSGLLGRGWGSSRP
jgi:hypothetical protein